MNTITRDTVLVALREHIGKENGISAARLVRKISGDMFCLLDERQLRQVIVELRHEGHHIGAHPSTGYYLCRSPAELNEACLFLYERAMTSLTQISAMKRISLPDLAGQLKLPT